MQPPTHLRLRPHPLGAHTAGKLQIPARPTWVKGHITLPGGRCFQNPSGGATSKAWPPGVTPAHLTLGKVGKATGCPGRGWGIKTEELPTKTAPAWRG